MTKYDEASVRFGSEQGATLAMHKVLSVAAAIREELREEMLRQPLTENRTTYSDGYASGLARAIGLLDSRLPAMHSLPA